MRCWQLAKAQLVAKEQGWQGFVTMQNHYNLLHREDERDLIPFVEDQGMGLIPWSPLARGRIARAGTKAISTERGSEDENIQNMLYGDKYDPVLDDVVFMDLYMRLYCTLPWLKALAFFWDFKSAFPGCLCGLPVFILTMPPFSEDVDQYLKGSL